MLPGKSQEIEVEVLSSTDLSRPTVSERETADTSRDHPFPDIRRWGNRMRTLDMRWWPLWLFLGIIATALLATLGLVVFVFYVILRLFRRFLRLMIGKS